MAGPTSSLHTHLRAWRRYAGFTQEHIANIIGVKFNTVSGWETGKRTVDLDNLKKMADLYGVHPAALLFAPPGDAKFETLRNASEIVENLSEDQAKLWLNVGRAMTTKTQSED